MRSHPSTRNPKLVVDGSLAGGQDVLLSYQVGLVEGECRGGQGGEEEGDFDGRDGRHLARLRAFPLRSFLVRSLTLPGTQQFTGGKDGGIHITDASNACRTLLFNLHKQSWCQQLCDFFDFPPEALPEVVSNSEVYGVFRKGHLLEGVPIAGLIGDQQAALVGNKCLTKGDAKQTYGQSRASLLLPFLRAGARIMWSCG